MSRNKILVFLNFSMLIAGLIAWGGCAFKKTASPGPQKASPDRQVIIEKALQDAEKNLPK